LNKKLFENSRFFSENFLLKISFVIGKTKWKIVQRKLVKIERKKNVQFNKILD
jgi:hypothetical protein